MATILCFALNWVNESENSDVFPLPLVSFHFCPLYSKKENFGKVLAFIFIAERECKPSFGSHYILLLNFFSDCTYVYNVGSVYFIFLNFIYIHFIYLYITSVDFRHVCFYLGGIPFIFFTGMYFLFFFLVTFAYLFSTSGT